MVNDSILEMLFNVKPRTLTMFYNSSLKTTGVLSSENERNTKSQRKVFSVDIRDEPRQFPENREKSNDHELIAWTNRPRISAIDYPTRRSGPGIEQKQPNSCFTVGLCNNGGAGSGAET
ncbi:Protein of unknown function [Pyronema omphalodes CBS 100304]|uniref:Uncharacterized protein n=1 Tax=Pyronema omphalodes (strain CBS 100304) TaxID=1076935 RepID=U4LGY5_PYROM|nr:Protein of unknown function [Pyronema omphalodes CBS 100304]